MTVELYLHEEYDEVPGTGRGNNCQLMYKIGSRSSVQTEAARNIFNDSFADEFE